MNHVTVRSKEGADLLLKMASGYYYKELLYLIKDTLFSPVDGSKEVNYSKPCSNAKDIVHS